MAKNDVGKMNCKTSLFRNTSKRNPGLTFFEGEIVGLPVVGVAVGEELGLFVGFVVGVALGLTVGLDVTGLAEGDTLGETVGFELGDDVGLVVGPVVTGLAEGDEVGATVGFELGDDVGLVLGLPVTGFAVGDEVGTLVGWKQQVICISFEFLSIFAEFTKQQTYVVRRSTGRIVRRGVRWVQSRLMHTTKKKDERCEKDKYSGVQRRHGSYSLGWWVAL